MVGVLCKTLPFRVRLGTRQLILYEHFILQILVQKVGSHKD